MKFLDIEWEDPKKVPKKLSDYIDKIAKIDVTDIKTGLIEIIHHDAQIIKHLYAIGFAISAKEVELKEAINEAIVYYNFKIKRKLTATQAQMAIKNDIDVANVEHELNILQAQLKFFENAQEILKKKSWHMKNIIEWEIYTQGNK